MTFNFEEHELRTLYEALIYAIEGNNRAEGAVCGKSAIEALELANKSMFDLKNKIGFAIDCKKDEANKKDPHTFYPNVLIGVFGGLVQSVFCDIPGTVCEIFDEDTDEFFEENKEEYYKKLMETGNYKQIY